VTTASIAFAGGFLIMVLEIIGARLLATSFGGAFYVWVSQIGVIMLALAIGYYVGGRLADRFASPSLIGYLLLLAGCFTALIPNFATSLANMIVDRHPIGKDIPLIWQKLDPAFGSAMIFLLPCIVLGMVCPYMIRLATSRISEVGKVSGLIYAASTIGSIVGVFVSGYVLIDRMPISRIFRLAGIMTMILGLMCILGGHLRHTLEDNT
jgi:predicted MFS family arabinose efflux permease